AQFFLLRLKLIVELLHVAQCFMQTSTIIRRVDRGADVLADAIEKLDIPRGNFAQKANLEYSIERCIVDDGQNRHRSRFAGAQGRVDIEVGSIQRIEVHEPSLRCCLACQTYPYLKAM